MNDASCGGFSKCVWVHAALMRACVCVSVTVPFGHTLPFACESAVPSHLCAAAQQWQNANERAAHTVTHSERASANVTMGQVDFICHVQLILLGAMRVVVVHIP